MTNSLPIVTLLLGLSSPEAAASLAQQKSIQLAQEGPAGGSESSGGAALLGASGGMDDAEAKCYAARYTDLNATVDPKSHWNSIGKAEGRLGACAKKLTQFEAQRYLNMNPDLQKQFGRTGGEARNKANKHFMTSGYKEEKYVNSTRNEFTEPWFCGVGQYSNCQCQGVMYFGPTKRPDSGAEIKTFDDMRQWRTIAKETDNWTMCSAQDFGSDPWPNQEKQCYCEPKPQYEPSKCADEGDDCLCNGWVMFGIKTDPDDPSQDAEFEVANQMPFTVNDANRTASISCSASSFEDADPLPKGKKQCFCDEEKQLIDQESVNQIKDYWRAQVAQQQMEIVYQTTSQVVSQAQDDEVNAAASAATKTAQQNDDDAKDEGTCSQCAIQKVETETKMKKKKIQQDKIDREKESVRKHEEVIKKQSQSSSKKTQSQTLRIQAESTTSIATKTILIEQAERLVEDAAKLDSDAEIENEKVIEEDQSAIKNEQTEIREAEKERITMEREAVEKSKKEENRKKLRKAQMKQQQAIEAKKIIEQKMQANRVKQKTAQQIEINMQRERIAVEKQVLVEKRKQEKIKKNMMTTDGGDYSVQKQTEVTVKYTTKKLREDKIRREVELKKQQEKYEEVKRQQIIIIQQRQAEAHKHQVIRIEAQKAAEEMRRRQQSIQQQIQVSTGMGGGGSSSSSGSWSSSSSSSTTTRTTTTSTITTQQVIELQKELKAIETQVETNTKIAELEAKTENKALKEVEEANTFIAHEAKQVSQITEQVSNVTNAAVEAEQAEEQFEENKEEDNMEEESVGEEIIAFQKNATAVEKATQLEEQRQELNNRTTYYVTYRRQWETNHQHYIQMREQSTRNITYRRTQWESSKNETEKIILLKEIEQMEQEVNATESKDVEEKAEATKMELEVKEVEKAVNETEVIAKVAQEEAKKEEELVQKTQTQAVVIRRRALGKKQDKCKMGKTAFETERDALDAVKKTERKAIDDAVKEALAQDMAIAKQQGEIAKFGSQKSLLISRRQKETVQAELAKLDTEIRDLDAKARLAQQAIQAAGASKAATVATQGLSQDKIAAQERKVRAAEAQSKGACQISYSAEQKMTAYVSSQNQTSSTTTTTVTGSRGGAHHHHQQRRIVYQLQDQAVQRRRTYSRSWQIFRRTRTEYRTRIVYYQRQIDQYTITITNYRYMWDQHRTRIQELRNMIQTSSDSTMILKYKGEITKLKSDIDEYRKQIEVTTAQKQKIVTQKRASRGEVKKMRGQVEQLKKDAQEAEQTVTTTLSAQSGMAAKAEKAQEQAEIKTIEYETKRLIVEEEKKAQKQVIAKRQSQIAEYEMNEKEAQEVVINLRRRKESIDTSGPDAATIIATVDAEIASEEKVAEEQKLKKETVTKEIIETRTRIEKEEAEVKRIYTESKAAEKTSQEMSIVQEAKILKTQGEKIQKEAAVKRLEQAKQRKEEMEEEERTEELIEKDQMANYTRIQEEVKAEEKEMKEAEEVVAKEEAEVKELQTKITRETTTKEQAAVYKVEIERRQRVVVEKRRVVQITEEKKAKNKLIEEAMKESIQEQEGEILAAKKEVEKVVAEAKVAETQITNTKTSQTVTSKKAVRKLEKEERASRRRIEQLEVRIEENKRREKKIVEEKAAVDKELPAAEMEFRQQQASVQRDEVSTLVTTCTRLLTEKTELFDLGGLGFSKAGDKGNTDGITSCLACGSGSTGVSQVLLPIASAQKAEEVAQILFSKALIADVEEIRSSRKASIVNGEIKVTTPEAQVRLLMTTSDSRLSELMQEIITWDADAQNDIQVTPLKYGKSEYFDFVKQSTRVASAQTGVIRQRICSGGNCSG